MEHERVIREAFRGLLRTDLDYDIDRTPLAELGIDSLDFFEALIELEEQHGLQIPIEQLDSNLTLADLFAIAKK